MGNFFGHGPVTRPDIVGQAFHREDQRCFATAFKMLDLDFVIYATNEGVFGSQGGAAVVSPECYCVYLSPIDVNPDAVV